MVHVFISWIEIRVGLQICNRNYIYIVAMILSNLTRIGNRLIACFGMLLCFTTIIFLLQFSIVESANSSYVYSGDKVAVSAWCEVNRHHYNLNSTFPIICNISCLHNTLITSLPSMYLLIINLMDHLKLLSHSFCMNVDGLKPGQGKMLISQCFSCFLHVYFVHLLILS